MGIKLIIRILLYFVNLSSWFSLLLLCYKIRYRKFCFDAFVELFMFYVRTVWISVLVIDVEIFFIFDIETLQYAC